MVSLPTLDEFRRLYASAPTTAEGVQGATSGFLQGTELGSQIAARRAAQQQRQQAFALAVQELQRKQQATNADVTLKGAKTEGAEAALEGDFKPIPGLLSKNGKPLLYNPKTNEMKEGSIEAQGASSITSPLAAVRKQSLHNSITNDIDKDKSVQNALDLLNRTNRLEVAVANRQFDQISPQEQQELINGLSTISIGGKPTNQTVKDLGFNTVQEAAARVKQFFSGDPQATGNPNVIALIQAQLGREREILKGQYNSGIEARLREKRSLLKDFPDVADDIRAGANLRLAQFDPSVAANAATTAAGQLKTTLAGQNLPPNPVITSALGASAPTSTVSPGVQALIDALKE